MTEPTDEEIRRVLAEKVMGWTFEGVLYVKPLVQGPRDLIPVCDWNPLRNIEQAMMCAEKLPKEKHRTYIAFLAKFTYEADAGADLHWRLAQATAEQRARACYEAVKEE